MINDDFSRVLHLTTSDISVFKNKTVMITGANGLIGGYLADFFAYLNTKHGYRVKLILTSLSTNPSRLQHLLANEYVTYYPCNLAYDIIEDVPLVDYCFYCAGYAQPSKFMSKSQETIFLNSNGLYSVFSSIFNKNSKARCVYLSSSEIYSANSSDSAHTEKDNITININNKRNPYILGKLVGETLVADFRSSGYDAISARVSLCYGPGVLNDDSRVLSELVHKGLKESDYIQLFDDGSALRRYIHISDFIVMLLNITVQGKHSTYNLCGEEECTIFEIATIVANKFQKYVKKGDTSSIVATTAPKVVWNSLDLYKSEFDNFTYKPLIGGVNEFVDWYVESLKR